MPEPATLDLSDLPDQLDLADLPDKQHGFDLSDLPDKINVTGEPRGGFGEFTQGLNLTTVPRDVAESLSPLTGALHDLKTSSQALYDVLSGNKSISDAALQRFGESRGLVGIEKKPIRQRTETGLDVAMQMLFAKEIAKGVPLSRTAQTAAPAQPEGGPATIDVASIVEDLPDQTTPEPPAEASPSVALDHVAKQLPVEGTQTVPAPAGNVVAVPTAQIASRPELMQFKKIDDQTTGTNEADRITGKYDPNFAGLLQLWEPNNPQEYGLTNEQKYIVANGHHRNAAATEQGVETQNAQIFRESAGVSAGDARTIAAESNIADGKGTIYDQTKFIRNFAETHGPDAAVERAGQIGARGRKAAAIAINAGPDLYTSFVNEQISPDAAASIADVAPGNDGLQRLGIQRAAKGDEPAAIYNFIQAAQAQMGDAAPDATQVDLFGSNDVALQAAEQMAKRAGAIQKEIGEQIAAVQGAAKRPEKARSLGVDVSDPAAVNARLDQLKQLRERARAWAMDTQIRDLAMSDVNPQDAVSRLGAQTADVQPALPGGGTVDVAGSTPAAPDLETVQHDPGIDYGPVERLRAEAIKQLGLKDWANAQNFSKANDAIIKSKMVEIAQTHPDFARLFEQRGDRIFHKATGQPILGPREASKEGWETGMPLPETTVAEPGSKPVEAPAAPATPKFDIRAAGRENKARFNAAISALADASPMASVEMTSPTHPGLRVIITPDVEAGKWRSTRIDAKGPMGHNIFDSREKAISDFTGGHIQSHAAYGRDFVVSNIREPQALKLAAPESDAEMLARQKAEAASNAALEAEQAAKDKLKFGWQQPGKVGDAGDLGQMGLGGDVGAPSDLFGFGPGAAAAGEIKLRAGSQLRQLSEAVADSLKAQGPKAGATQRVNAAATAAAKVSKGVTPMQRRANTVKAMWQALRNFYVNPTTPSLLRPGSGTGTDFIKALKDWQGADQRASFEVRQWIHEMRKGLDPMTDEGITNYIEADGDPAVLQQRANAGGKYGPGYDAALKLTPEQINIAENMKQYFAGMLQDGINLGMLDHGIENYITHLVKQPNKVTNALMADLQSGKLQKNFKYALKRVFDTHFDLEQAGYEPLTKRASELLSAYDLSFRRALNARVFIKALRGAKAADGEPVTRFSGMTQQVPRGDVPAEAYLIKSRALPKNAIAADGTAYKVIDHPALRGWKFVVQEGAELPAYYQADMLVHPNHFDHLKNVLAVSKLRTGPLGAVAQPFLKFGALAKQTRLSLSIFHLDQEGLHGLFHRVNPANLDQINFDDPKQWALVRNGLQVADYSAMELFSEGLRGGGLVAKIPGLGELQNRFNEFLFKDYIPRLKMTMATHAFDRNVKRYPNLSPEVIAEMTARQGNAAFGELNYKLMGRSPTVQDFLRLSLLAPDFLEARSKFVGQALKPYGGEQRMALLLGGATLYATARVLNQWLDNDPHFEPNKAFSVVYNGREYRLRTVMGDVANLLSDPRRFFYNRFSPWLKTGVTLGTQRDYRGIKLNGIEQVKDALSWFVPIPLGQGNEADSISTYIQQTPQRILSSGGLENKPAETPIDQTYKAALRFKETLKDPKIQAEVRRAQQETYAQGDYARLNRALLENDKERAVTEIIGLMKDKGKTPVDLAKYYDGLPSSPFTGSLQLDARWRGAMSQPEHDLYAKAVGERIGMARLFFQLYRMAAEQYRKELK